VTRRIAEAIRRTQAVRRVYREEFHARFVTLTSLSAAMFFTVVTAPRPPQDRKRGQVHPPINAEFLFHLMMSPQNADALAGDLQERYKHLYKKFGRRRAKFWYWFQTFISLRPIIWAANKKPLAALASMAAAKGLIGHDGWLAAVVEFVKKVRS
jgi:hypothetical protein